MPQPRTLWRKDVTAVPASTRRAAGYALQLVRAQPRLDDRSALGALWTLCLPLFEPDQVAAFLSQAVGRDPDDAWADAEDDDVLQPQDDAILRGRLRRLFQRIPHSLVTRLTQADAAAPPPVIGVLGESLALDDTALRILAYLQRT